MISPVSLVLSTLLVVASIPFYATAGTDLRTSSHGVVHALVVYANFRGEQPSVTATALLAFHPVLVPERALRLHPLRAP